MILMYDSQKQKVFYRNSGSENFPSKIPTHTHIEPT